MGRFEPALGGSLRVSPIDAHISKRIAEFREALALTQLGLADRLGMPVSDIAAWEAGEVRVPAERLLALLAPLACSLEDLFEGMTDGPEGSGNILF